MGPRGPVTTLGAPLSMALTSLQTAPAHLLHARCHHWGRDTSGSGAFPLPSCHLGRLFEQMLAGCTLAEMELKLKGLWNLGSKADISPVAAEATGLPFFCRLCKLSPCRTFEWTPGALTSRTGLALAAVGFVCRHMWDLGQARFSAASTTPVAGPRARLLQSWDLNSMDLHWGLYKNISWGTGLLADIPKVEKWLRAVPTTVYCIDPLRGWQETK